MEPAIGTQGIDSAIVQGDLPLEAAAPPNDDRTNALSVSLFEEVLFNVAGAILEPAEDKPSPDALGKTVWFRWKASFTGVANISISDWGATAVYRQSDPDFQRYPPNFSCRAGETYYIQIDSLSPAYESYRLKLTATPQSVARNDNFVDRVPFEGNHIQGPKVFSGAAHSGELRLLSIEPDNQPMWLLFGDAAKFSVEVSGPDFQWRPYLDLDLSTGSGVFLAPAGPHAQFIRAARQIPSPFPTNTP